MDKSLIDFEEFYIQKRERKVDRKNNRRKKIKRSRYDNKKEIDRGLSFIKKGCICRFPSNCEACMVMNAWRGGGTMERDRYEMEKIPIQKRW